MEQNKGSMPVWAKWLLNVFLGAFVGIGAILPGLSGGVMCVLFGVYQPLMETLSHPFTGIKKHWRLLVPVVIGIAVGFVGFAGVMDWLLAKDALLMQSIFLGLLLSTIPSFWKDASETKRTKASWVAFGVMFAVMVLVLSFLSNEKSTQMAQLINGMLPQADISASANFGGFIIAGVFLALSIVMPGMSFSTPLMCLGLYIPLNNNLAALGKLDFSVVPSCVIPVGIGALATLILFAKPINALFEKKRSVAYHLVMGAVFASTLLLIPIKFDGVAHGIWCLVGLAGGAVIGYLLDIVQSKVKE